MTFASYAHTFEDVMLWRVLGHVGNGLCIDVGAKDPKIDSDSVMRAFAPHSTDIRVSDNYEWRDRAGMFNVVNLSRPRFARDPWLPSRLATERRPNVRSAA